MGWFNRKKEDPQHDEEGANNASEALDFDFTEIRKKSMERCLDAGFTPANSLPLIKPAKVRPAVEIAGRLNAIKAMVFWLMVPENDLPNEPLQKFIAENNLTHYISDDEAVIFAGPRDDEDWRNAIGWKFENAWPLAWYFGHKEPEISGQMMSGEDIQEILDKYSCPLDENVEEWAQKLETVDDQQVLELEDLFYCLHNAARSAQMGRDTVPEGFNILANGGVIHERRLSLTWMISYRTDWEDTDLST